MQLKLLGALSLQSVSAPIAPEAMQKRRLALLALLAIGEDRGLSRDRLQAYLWPESSATRARHALDQLIYATRHSLGADPILSDGRELRLDRSILDTDLRQFGDAIRDERFADAASIYAGPLLEGFHITDSRELEAWIDTERSRFHAQYQNALESLARTAANQGDKQAAISWWLKVSVADPLSSRVAAETIRSFSCAGDNAGAIRHARNYQDLVRKDLEIEPDPAIEKMISELPRPQYARPREHVESESTLVRPAGETSNDQNAFTLSQPTHVRLSRHGPVWKTRAVLAAVTVIGLVASVGIIKRIGAEGAASARASVPPVVNPAARAFYLRGVNSWNDRSKAALDTAVIYFRKATESEPDFAEAHAGLANAYVMIGYSGYRSAGAMFPKAKAAALRAIVLDSTIAAPYAALGMELTWERKFDSAEVAYRRAIKLEPSYATAHQWYGILLMILGRTQEALAETHRAAELDPLSLQIQNNYASFLYGSGQKAAALQHYQRVVGDEPDSAWVRRNPWLLTNMASVYAANGQFGKALRFGERATEILPGHPRAVYALANVYYRMGRRDEARRIFSTADTSNEHYPAYRGFMYATEGQLDSAFAWFDRVREWGIPIMISLPGLRKAQGMENDPRLPLLFERLGLPFVPLPSKDLRH